MVSSRPARHFCEGAGTGQRLQLYEDPAQSEPPEKPSKVFMYLHLPLSAQKCCSPVSLVVRGYVSI